MQIPRFVLALRTRLLKNKIPDWCDLSDKALVQVQLHQKKTNHSRYSFPRSWNMSGHEQKTCLCVHSCITPRALSHSRRPARPQQAKRSKPWASCAPSTGQFVLVGTAKTSNEIKVNKPTNHNPLIACNYGATLMTLLRSLPSCPARSQVLLPLSAWESVLRHRQHPVLLLAASPARTFPLPPLPRLPKPTRSRVRATGSSSRESD